MKNINFKKIFITLFVLFFVFSFFTISGEVYSADETITIDNYVPLSNLPYAYDKVADGTPGGSRNLGSYVSGLFKLLIALCIVMAVFMITLAGVQYLTTSVTNTKGAARARINAALLGLALALLSWLALNTINPALTTFSLNLSTEALAGVTFENKTDATPPGYYYIRRIEGATATSTKLYIFGYGDQENVPFFTVKKCDDGLKAARNAGKIVLSCIPIPNSDFSKGSFAFKTLDGQTFGFTTEDSCDEGVARFVRQQEGRLVNSPITNKPCHEIVGASGPRDATAGWYFEKHFLNGVVETDKSRRFNSEEECNQNTSPGEIIFGRNDQTDSTYSWARKCIYYNSIGGGDGTTGSAEQRFHAIMADEDRVQDLLDIGSGHQIKTNKDWAICPGPPQKPTSCTTVGLLPPEATTGLLRLAAALPNGATTITHKMIITGGTEWWWHQTHGPGLANVDLKTKNSAGANVLLGLDKWIIENTPNKPDKITPEAWERYKNLSIGDPFRPADFSVFVVEHSTFWAPVSFRYEYETPDHWHVMFPPFNN
ncbi:hypothetical protein COW81_00235 [Candidatus Campbellbacteria bacterium CG22_combo_CG10-13_8_21_14_all_36_13]|uniref:Uncharacterized protein n=1 Tax=Candidatus Campbellbacteria bacterium CG22_combo_CG10-13_8_21_14_all_36_13 TaxID=1974529 RepID=A0A2H0DZY7_9BACT|nr:MAG: hypothetical protein COW81_00235 [Candidatus Campbellbacteria bacterium CG22_combo_CG10-13_8_21_14_all_36_13]